VRPYLANFGARFRMLLQYRVAALAGLGTQFFWGLIRMMIFSAFYRIGPDGELSDAARNAPMDLDQVITYIWMGQAFLMLLPFRTDAELAGQIRTGNVTCQFLRPVDLHSWNRARPPRTRWLAAPTRKPASTVWYRTCAVSAHCRRQK
jgi:ABC-2 type transport system permease protein